MEFCKVTGCNRTVEKEDLCSKHYAAKCLGEELDIPSEKPGGMPVEPAGKEIGEIEKFVPTRVYDKKNAGLKMEDRISLHKEQGKVCACCGDPIAVAWLARVDFNPETGMVRELICKDCQTIMRGSKADIAKLEKALAYAQRHHSEEEEI